MKNVAGDVHSDGGRAGEEEFVNSSDVKALGEKEGKK